MRRLLLLTAILGTTPCWAQLIDVEFDANRIVYDETRGLLYASVPGSALKIGNTITQLDPLTLETLDSVGVGSEPLHLALSDSRQSLYVGLDGAGQVARVDLSTFVLANSFSLGAHKTFGTNFANDLHVQPGTENVVAVSMRNVGVSPEFAGVAIYENGVARPVKVPRHIGPNAIEFSDDPALLYGFGNGSSALDFYRMAVDASGVSILTETAGLFTEGDIVYKAGRVYGTDGRAINPESLTLLGSYPGQGLVIPDPALSKVYFLSRVGQTTTVSAFDLQTFSLVDSRELQGISGDALSFVKWGGSGLAFNTDEGHVYSYRTSLVWNSQHVPPTGLNVVRGHIAVGGLPALLNNEGQRLILRPGVVFTTSQAPILLEITATAPNPNSQSLAFTFESNGTSSSIVQTASLYNYTESRFDQVDVRALTGSDVRFTVDMIDNGADYIQPGTGQLKAQVTYKANGPVLSYPWQARIDLVRWTFPQ